MSEANMSGKVVIVTGANTGMGYETAVELARRGATVVMACRSVDRGEKARAELLARVPGANAHVMALDLGSQASIRAFVASFEQRFSRLDVLVNNAALVPSARTVTADGHEAQLAINHLGPMLLTNLLLPRLRASAPSRVVVVSSSVHDGAKIDWEDLEATKKYSAMGVYARTKLMNLLWVRSLSERLAGSGVTVNALHPGVVATELAREFPLPFRLLARVAFASPAKGARTAIWLSTAPEVADVSGKYFASCKEKKPSAAALDRDAAERLWEISSRMLASNDAVARSNEAAVERA